MTSTADPAAGTGPDRARLAPGFGIRTRLLAWYLVLVAVALGAALLVVRQTLRDSVVAESDRSLNAAADSLRRQVETARGSGRPVPVTTLFDQFLDRGPAPPGRAYLTIVDGRPHRASPGADVPLDGRPELSGWADLTTSASGDLDTPAGRARWLAVPVTTDGRVEGTLVAADLLDARLADADRTTSTIAVLLLVVLVAAGLVAWGSASRALRPLRRLSATTRSISSGVDLDARIPVEGRDEVAELAGSFNDMLERLRRAFASQEGFLDAAGHELLTPITVVRGHVELLEEEPPAARAASTALVLEELDRMSRLVEDLRVLARAEHPDFVRASPVDLGALTRDLAARASTLAPDRVVLGPVADGTAAADGQRLTQAALALASNAAAVTRPGDTVAISSRLERGTFRLTVSDTGPGVHPDLRPHLFDRSRPRHLLREGGTGLGLPIAMAIARAHGGTIEVADEPGGGTAFTIAVPHRPAEEPVIDLTDSGPEEGPAPPGPRSAAGPPPALRLGAPG